jgi:hypothetical protein
VRIAFALGVLAACGRFGFGGGGKASDAASDVVRDQPDAFQLAGLVARYSMDGDLSQGVIDDDFAGHAAHCVPGVTCPTSVPGHLGNALAFDGTTQFARVTYGSWLDMPTAYTYAAWIEIDAQFDQVAFARPFASGSDDIVDIVSWTTGAGVCMESAGSTGANESVCGPTLNMGTWFHAAGRWDGAKKAIFIDGVKLGELPSTVSMMDNSDLVIGSDENTGSTAYMWHGKVDELELYDRALSDSEIAELAAQ